MRGSPMRGAHGLLFGGLVAGFLLSSTGANAFAFLELDVPVAGGLINPFAHWTPVPAGTRIYRDASTGPIYWYVPSYRSSGRVVAARARARSLVRRSGLK